MSRRKLFLAGTMLADLYKPARNIQTVAFATESSGAPKNILFKRYSLWLTFAGQPNNYLNSVNTVCLNKTRRTLRHYMALHIGQRFLFDNVAKSQFSLFSDKLERVAPQHIFGMYSHMSAPKSIPRYIYRLFTNCV